MPKNTPKFSLYFLPFVGAFTYLLCDSLSLIWIPLLPHPSSSYSFYAFILEVLITYSSSIILLTIILFLVLIPLLYFFKLNVISFKNTSVMIVAIALYKIYEYGLFRAIASIIYKNEEYHFLINSIFVMANLNILILLIIPLTIFLYFFKSFLDCYEKPLPQGQKKWLLANILSIAGIFSLILWIIYAILDLFLFIDISFIKVGRGEFFIFFPTYIALAFMMLSKKIILTDIKTRTVLITGVVLAAFSLCLLIISASLLDGAGYGIYIILPFLLVVVPIATIIFTIVVVNKMYPRYK